MNPVDSTEYQGLEDAYAELMSDSLLILEDVQLHTKRARKAIDLDPVDANTLANEIVELAILNQRLGDRVARAGNISRAAENHYKTVREEHKLRLVQVGEEREVEEATGTKSTKKVKQMVKMAAGVADSAKMKLAQKEFDLSNAALGLYETITVHEEV
jgi:hypothetical protein